MIGGIAGFLSGLFLFINFNSLWIQLGQLEVFGFMAIVVMVLMMIAPFALILAPFIGIWIGVTMGGKIYKKIYPEEAPKV